MTMNNTLHHVFKYLDDWKKEDLDLVNPSVE